VSADTYGYRAIDATGTIQTGILTGADPDGVAERIRRMGLRPISVRRRRSQQLFAERSLRTGGTKRADALATFSRQLATMIDAGTPLLPALSVLQRQGGRGPAGLLAEAVGVVRGDIENGDQLSVALARQPGWFDEFYVSMVEAGEAAGSLPLVLERLADATEARVRLRRRIRSALAYPVAVSLLIGLTVIAMLTYLIPTFRDIFTTLGGDLPVPTQLLLAASRLLTGSAPLLLVLSAAAWWWFRRWRKSDRGARAVDRARLRMPVFGRLVSLAALARFSRSLAVLVRTGVPVVDSLRIATTTAGNHVIADAGHHIARAVGNGSRMSEAMSKESVFTEVVTQMVSVGEDTGALDDMLVKVADSYELQVETTVDSLTSLLEPLLIVVMGLVVGGILLAVYLPMFDAISLVK